MRQPHSTKTLCAALLASLCSGASALQACSSSSSTTGFANDAGGSSDTAVAPVEAGGGTTACTSTSALQILFNPMYSAFDGAHSFQIPAIVNGASNTGLSWSASPASAVTIAPDPSSGGVLITMQQAPSSPVTITANAGGQCGTATLDITSATAAQWQTGNARYNSGVPFYPQCVVKNLPFPPPDGGCPDAGPACTNCHGPTAMAQFGFQDIAHTPEQTGGFSDQDMIGIFTQGVVPGCGTTGACKDGGYFDPTIISIPDGGPTAYEVWHSFHQWTDIQGPDQQAMVVYLRSLTPTPQTGSSNFGGGRPGDGGFGPPPFDAGFGPD